MICDKTFSLVFNILSNLVFISGIYANTKHTFAKEMKQTDYK